METKFFDSQRFTFYIVLKNFQIRAYDIRIVRSADKHSSKQTKPHYRNIIDRQNEPENSRDDYNMAFARIRYPTMNWDTIHRIDCRTLDMELKHKLHRRVIVIFNKNTK